MSYISPQGFGAYAPQGVRVGAGVVVIRETVVVEKVVKEKPRQVLTKQGHAIMKEMTRTILTKQVDITVTTMTRTIEIKPA
ncbi:MAG: hypothetical protein DRJ40_11090 [Thermoprotei archaeon]|nr:MAG: hypothetical protein DRJ40_11090 [Thermoprotei archaeon]